MSRLKNIFRCLFVFVSGIVLTSCSGMLYTTIDVLRPAKISFPEDVNKLLIVNNTVAQPENYGHKTESLDGTRKQVSVETDSLPVFALASLMESVLEKEFFNSVDLLHESQNEKGDFLEDSLPDSTMLKRLSIKYGVDGIIFLNRLSVRDQFGELYDQENLNYVAYLEARYEYKWSIHFPRKHQVFSLTTKDTVYWESEAYSLQEAIKKMPDRKDALIDGALITGQRVVNKFIPYWEQVDRYLFDVRAKKFKAGMDSVYTKNWNAAIRIWEGLWKNSRASSSKSKIAHNLSVVYEIKGDLKQALAYSQAALETLFSLVLFENNTYVFMEEQHETLKKRLNELDMLNKQLGEE